MVIKYVAMVFVTPALVESIVERTANGSKHSVEKPGGTGNRVSFTPMVCPGDCCAGGDGYNTRLKLPARDDNLSYVWRTDGVGLPGFAGPATSG